MKARRLLWAGVAACVVLLGFGVVHCLFPPPGVTEANWKRLRDGMTLREVQDVIGEPPRFVAPGGAVARWEDPETGALLVVWFRSDGGKDAAAFHPDVLSKRPPGPA